MRKAGTVLLGVGACLLLGTALASASPASSPDGEQRAYIAALRRARTVLEAPAPADQQAARAAAILRAGAPGEREAINLLEARPPGIEFARVRLDTSIAGFAIAARDPDPAGSAARLRNILAEPRFHPDEGPIAAVTRALGGFFRSLLRALLGPGPVQLLVLVLLAAGVALLLVLLVPALRRPLLRGRRVPGAARGDDTGVPEYFQVAEALAGAGDFAAAVRALAAGTMELISGERSFTASPLTVRETFRRSGSGDVLRPLLKAFERSHYGHYQAAGDDYATAASAAAEYRRGVTHEDAA